MELPDQEAFPWEGPSVVSCQGVDPSYLPREESDQYKRNESA